MVNERYVKEGHVEVSSSIIKINYIVLLSLL